MTQELVSLTIIMAVAAVSPIVAQLIPEDSFHKPYCCSPPEPRSARTD